MLGFSQFLTERRAHADKYERENVYKTIRKYASDSDVYVHFASIPKLGVTPTVRWDTPHGVYGWSMKYHGPKVREQIDKILSMSISPRDEREWVEYRLAMKQLDKLVYFCLVHTHLLLERLHSRSSSHRNKSYVRMLQNWVGLPLDRVFDVHAAAEQPQDDKHGSPGFQRERNQHQTRNERNNQRVDCPDRSQGNEYDQRNSDQKQKQNRHLNLLT